MSSSSDYYQRKYPKFLSETAQVFLDTETTGLDDAVHEIWELGALKRNKDGTEEHFLVQLKVDISKADPQALEIGGFHERYDEESAVYPVVALDRLLDFAQGGVLFGLNIAFDLRFLARLLERYKRVSTWHYAAAEVKSIAGTALLLPPPWNTDAMVKTFLIDTRDFLRHSALGDCMLTAALYDAAMHRMKYYEGLSQRHRED